MSPNALKNSHFCDLFHEFERRLSPVMRQHHAADDKLFVDYSGNKVPTAITGVVRLEPHLRRGDLEPGAARLDRGRTRACSASSAACRA